MAKSDMDRNFAIDKDGNVLTYRRVVRLYLARPTSEWHVDLKTWTQQHIGKVVGK